MTLGNHMRKVEVERVDVPLRQKFRIHEYYIEISTFTFTFTHSSSL